jgi:hypothetical protein
MKMVGHRTEAIYRRYAIADEKSMKEAAEKLDQPYAIDQQPTENHKVTFQSEWFLSNSVESAAPVTG